METECTPLYKNRKIQGTEIFLQKEYTRHGVKYIQIQIFLNTKVFKYKYIGKYFKYIFLNTFHFQDISLCK